MATKQSRKKSKPAKVRKRPKAKAERKGEWYYIERQNRVAELRAVANMTFEQIGQEITKYGFRPISAERVYRDWQQFKKRNALLLDSLETRAEIQAKLQGLYDLALISYNEASRQVENKLTKELVTVTDHQAQSEFLRRALETVREMKELAGVSSSHGGNVAVPIELHFGPEPSSRKKQS